MYFVLYDRNLKSIGETYILESWSRIQRAVDFDDLRIVGEQIPFSANPFLVVVNDRQGRMMFSGLASVPDTDEKTKKTNISLKDYATLFNTDILIDWSKFSGSTVGSFLSFVLGKWLSQTDVGLSGISWDVSALGSLPLDTSIQLGSSLESTDLHSLVFDAIKYYDLYYTTNLNLKNRTLTFSFFPAFTRSVSVRLRDFDVNVIEKSFGEYNRASVYSSAKALYQQWALAEDNSVVKLPSTKSLVYPAKNRNFVAKGSTTNDLYDAVYEAVSGLAGNRYQENIDLNAQKYRSILDLTSVDFSYAMDVYTDEGFYRKLPVGEIETDSSGKHIVRLGHRIQELTQEI